MGRVVRRWEHLYDRDGEQLKKLGKELPEIPPKKLFNNRDLEVRC